MILYLLIGPKGAGKSYISRLMEREFGIYFFRIEDIWLRLEKRKLKKSEKVRVGRVEIIKNLDRLFRKNKAIIIESTGTSENFYQFVTSLKARYKVVLIKVSADPKICMERIRKRDYFSHVPYEHKELVRINKLASRIEFDYDYLLDNNDMSNEALITSLQNLISDLGYRGRE